MGVGPTVRAAVASQARSALHHHNTRANAGITFSYGLAPIRERPHFDAKFRVLAENVRHHIEEEEGEMLPRAQKVKLDFAALAETMSARKEKLLEGGVPPVGEEVMVKASRGKGDSPARAAKRKAPKLPKRRS